MNFPERQHAYPSQNGSSNDLTEPDLSCGSDARLWDQFRGGNKNAFDIIYDTFFQSLCSYGDRICTDKSLVEDVVQDLFIYLWTKKERLGKTNSIKFYLFCCLRRRLMRVLAQEKRTSGLHAVLEPDRYHFRISLKESSTPSLEEEALRTKLTSALNRLTERQREAIYLKFYNDLSFLEVATIMDIEVRSVYNLIGRTLALLRAVLRPKEPSATTLTSLFLFFF